MRKSRFLISLIAATAIGLAGVGCESSDSGAVRDTSDISNTGTGTNRALREYLVIGQRGLEVPPAEFDAAHSLPTVPANKGTGVAPRDRKGIEGGLMYELLGIASVPNPDLQFVAPGQTSSDPVETTVETGISGFHQVYTSPSGRYIIGLSRSKDVGPGEEGTARIQVFHVDVPPTDVVFPPQPSFGAPAVAGASVFDYGADQGEFVSGTWSRNGAYFYYSYNGRIYKSSFSESNGALNISSTGGVVFPTGVALINNAVQMLVSHDGGFLFALDNANGAIMTYAIDPSSGDLTEVGSLATVADPRGFALDHTGTYLYVAGRESQQLAGYRVGADGGLTAIELFPADGLGAIPVTYGEPLGDVATSPVAGQLFLGAYSGTVSGFTIDPETGALVNGGVPGDPLNGARNLANLEVEPSGRFLLTVFEHDFDTFQDFVTPANGFPIDESNVFANTDSTTNGTIPTAAAPEFDSNGRVAYVFPTTEAAAFTGSVQSNRIGIGANVSVENAVSVENPYGLAFFQLVFAAPASTDTVVP